MKSRWQITAAMQVSFEVVVGMALSTGRATVIRFFFCQDRVMKYCSTPVGSTVLITLPVVLPVTIDRYSTWVPSS